MENKQNGRRFTTSQLTKMGMMAAVACVLGLFRAPLIPAVNFLTYDLADIPIIISGFAFGPVPGILITAVVSAIQAFMLGGDGIYGFIMHILASGTYVLIASVIYDRKKTKKGAILSMIAASAAMIVIMAMANFFITPYYYGGEAMREMVLQLMPLILLFNGIKSVLNSVITFVVYKRISPFLHKA